MANKSPRIEILPPSTTSLPAASKLPFKGLLTFLFVITLFIGLVFLFLSSTGLMPAKGSSESGITSSQEGSLIDGLLGKQVSSQTYDEVVASDVQNLATQIESAAVADPQGLVMAVYDTTENVSVSVGTASTQEVVLSDGVHITVAPGPFPASYIIHGWHESGEKYQSHTPLVYDSANGGMM